MIFVSVYLKGCALYVTGVALLSYHHFFSAVFYNHQ
jgi:hypothetical protein